VRVAEAAKKDDVPEQGQIDATRLVFRNRLFRVDNNMKPAHSTTRVSNCSFGLFLLF
jgi:hypothetical protein